MLEFNDGIKVDTSGDYRILRLSDGWYVVGNGMLMPCDNQLEAEDWIELYYEAHPKEEE